MERPPDWLIGAVAQWLGDSFWSDWSRAVGAAWTEATDGGERIDVTSWYRSPALNARVGGHPYSQHLI